jgi:hypothetical protein
VVEHPRHTGKPVCIQYRSKALVRNRVGLTRSRHGEKIKKEWQTLGLFGGSSVCLASRRFMRSDDFIVDLPPSSQ